MERITVKCVSCGHTWEAAFPFSIYEQQAVESCPCPRCGAYTLCCQEPRTRRAVHVGRAYRPVAVPGARRL